MCCTAREGAGSLVGTELAAKSAPDGYTLLVVALPFSVLQSLRPSMTGTDIREMGQGREGLRREGRVGFVLLRRSCRKLSAERSALSNF
jgi:hypothetical protein